MAKVSSLHDLLLHELGDLLDAEKQLLKALPTLAKAATDPDLKKGFVAHTAETEGQVKRLERAFKSLGAKPKKIPCAAMKGLIKEGAEVLKTKMPKPVKDAALIGAAQRVEHYEMAAYGTARAHAEVMGHQEVVQLLQATLDEESATNEKLTTIATGSVNRKANEEYPGM